MKEKRDEAKTIMEHLEKMKIDPKSVGYETEDFYGEEEMEALKAAIEKGGVRISGLDYKRIKYKTLTVPNLIKKRREEIQEKNRQTREYEKTSNKICLERFLKEIPTDLKKDEYIETPESIEYIEAVIGRGENIIIGGKTSCGKTRCAIEIARAYINNGGNAIYCSVNGIVFWQFEMISEMIRKIKNQSRGKPYLIIIDDIVEDIYRNASEREEWKKAKTQNLLKELFSSSAIIIITSNNNIESIKKIWDGEEKTGKISQRIYRTCYTNWRIMCPVCHKTIKEEYGIKTRMDKEMKCENCKSAVKVVYEMIAIKKVQ